MAKHNEKITINIKELNNKSRQGTYIYIKKPKQRPSYYKYNENNPIDYYIQYYQSIQERKDKKKGQKTKTYIKEYQETITTTKTEEIQTLKEKTKAKTDAEKYLKKLKRQYGGKTLEKMLKKGIQAIHIKNALKTTNSEIHIANRKLIQDIVLDKKLQDIISNEENMKKLRNRIEHRITIIGNDEEELANLNKVGKTLREAISEIQNTTRKGEEMKYEKNLNKLKNLGYTLEFKKKGIIKRVELTTILRKAR